MFCIFRRYDNVWHIVQNTHEARLDASTGVLAFCGERIVVTDLNDDHQVSPDGILDIYQDAVMSFRVPRLDPETLERTVIGAADANFQGPVCLHCQEQLYDAVLKEKSSPVKPEMEAVLYPATRNAA